MTKLTIDTGDLREIFLPAEQQERAAVEYLDAAWRRSAGKRSSGAVCRAWIIVKREHEKTVEMILKRGGLLLIGGAA